jgi:hypothetical protein
VLLALPVDIRIGWKGFPGTFTLAYYEVSSIADVKSFIKLVPGVSRPKSDQVRHLSKRAKGLHCFGANSIKKTFIFVTDAQGFNNFSDYSWRFFLV